MPLALLALLMPSPTAAQPSPDFPLGVYWPQERLAWLAEKAGMEKWEYSDQLLKRLAEDHHCNTIWTVNIGIDDLKQLCGLADKHGIGVAGSVPSVLWWRQHRTPEFAVRCAEHAVETFAETEGLAAYVLIDEPRMFELSYLDAVRREITLRDPTRDVITVTMRHDTPAAIHDTDFPVICSDIYPYYHHGDPNGPYLPHMSRGYYRNAADAFVEQCEARGKTYWMMPAAFEEIWGDWYYDEDQHIVAQPGAYLHSRMPTVGETRWQIWEAVASGCKAVVYFVLFPPGNDRTADSEPGPEPTHPHPKITEAQELGSPAALLNPDSTDTEQLVAMGEEFAEVRKLAPVLTELRRSPYPVAFSDEPLTCRTLRHTDGRLFVSVVNDDTNAEQSGEVRLLPGPTNARDLRLRMSLPFKPDAEGELISVPVRLQPGAGTLIELEGTRLPLATHVEDFETPGLPGKLESSEVKVVRKGWGVGWSYQLAQTDDATPGTMSCDVKTLTGDPTVHRPSGPHYIVYAGSEEGVELAFSTDGEAFTPAIGAQPLILPRDATHLRFTLAEGATLSSFSAIATEIP